VLAIVDFHPSGLPEGWVKEIAFRKTKEGLIRRDPYYMDPATSCTFREMTSVLDFIKTGKVPKRAFIQRIRVHDLYSFDKSVDLVIILFRFCLSNEKPALHHFSNLLAFCTYHGKLEHDSLRSRLIINETPSSLKATRSSRFRGTSQTEYDQNKNNAQGSDTSTDSDWEEEIIVKRKSSGKEATSSRTINSPRGRPKTFGIREEVTSDQDADRRNCSCKISQQNFTNIYGVVFCSIFLVCCYYHQK
ncbi:hypothetical protein BAE44_0018197, partial [Dichanthelium oligosanthes]